MLTVKQSFQDYREISKEIKNYLKQIKKLQKLQPKVHQIFDKIERRLDGKPVKHEVRV